MTEDEELRRRVAEQAADADPAGRAALEAVLAEMSPDGTTRSTDDRITPGQAGRRTGASPALIALGGALIFWGLFALVVALAERSIVLAVAGALLVAGGVPPLRSGLRRRDVDEEVQR